jgi:hypothetical protein
MGHRHYLFGSRHTYDGVHRTARPTNFGSWPESKSKSSAGSVLQTFGGLGRVTWASARRTRSSPGYQITGFQP